MEIQILKNCNVRLEGTMRALQAWSRLHLPDDKAKKLIDAGYAESAQPTAEGCRVIVADFGERDPGGECWPWIQENHAGLWEKHRQAMKNNDLAAARRTFDEMVTCWHGRQISQPMLKAA